jgi:hypothetical protein
MSALISIGNTKAILSQGRWLCCDLRLEARLQETLDAWVRETGGPPIGHKDPDGYAAKVFCQRHGYRFHLTTKTSKRKSNEVYLFKRQLELFA